MTSFTISEVYFDNNKDKENQKILQEVMKGSKNTKHQKRTIPQY